MVDSGRMVRSTNKYFNLSSNYLKGNADGFHRSMEEHHPSAFLFHEKITKGNTQDIITKYARPMHMFRLYHADHLDRQLRSLDKTIFLKKIHP